MSLGMHALYKLKYSQNHEVDKKKKKTHSQLLSIIEALALLGEN